MNKLTTGRTRKERSMTVKTKKQAKEIVGGLSSPSKLPSKAWGISAWKCQTGQKLARVKNSPCSQCYAMQGSYTMYPAIPIAHAKRLEAISDPRWVDAMVTLIGTDSHFRWFDSGDIQSEKHLGKIIEVAELTPNCLHWLPTQERGYVKAYQGIIPSNLIIRFSQTVIDRIPAQGRSLSSMVNTGQELPDYVKDCPSRFQDNACGDCRTCWDATVQVVAYYSHGRKIKVEKLTQITRKGA